ncbi:phosphotransferase-like protein [Kitasatospora atroaurantiaca]|uniref:phosphotransferase-like protein n=2 Tax=Kitasatospora atroaurantiaca TaxID=285545 RepID=UPI0011A53603
MTADEVLLCQVHHPLPGPASASVILDRIMPGLAAFQVERVHAHGVYDVEVDTGTTSAEDRALLVKEYLGRRTAPAAFDRLRQQASADPAGRGTP